MHSINEIKTILGNWDISADLKIEDITHTEWETQKKSEWKTGQVGDGNYLKSDETFDLMTRSSRAMVFLANNKEKFMNLL